MQKKVLVSIPHIEAKGGAERYALDIADFYLAQQDYEVFLASDSTENLQEVGRYYGLDLAEVNGVNFPDLPSWAHKLPRMAKLLLGDFLRVRQFRAMELDVFYECGYRWETPGVAKRNYYICHFPHEIEKAKNISTYHRMYMNFFEFIRSKFLNGGKKFFETYDSVVANSYFTRGHIQNRWGIKSQVIEPNCSIPAAIDILAERDKKILAVGRFELPIEDVPHKGQHYLLEAFADLTDLHKQGWELHFIGTAKGEGKTYLQELEQKATGLPVVFHPNASFEEMKQLMAESSIYWHAQGFGTDEEVAPQLQEHFGITTVEAMGSGLLPVVIGRAGPLEVAQDLGLTWVDLEGLKEKTRYLVTIPIEQLQVLRSRSRERAEQYSVSFFRQKMQALELLGKE